MTHLMTLNKWMWLKKAECVVEVISIGHFPTTAMVKLPDGRTIEVEINELRV